jgi:formate dehydrogenase assembly factor FdhD
MSEENVTTLTARIIHSEKKEVLDTIEQTLSFLKTTDAEATETRSLDEIISEFIQRVEASCNQRNVKVLNIEKAYDELAIGFAMSSKLAKEKSATMTIDIPVVDVKEDKEKGEHEQAN